MRHLLAVAALLVGGCQGQDTDSIKPGMWSSKLSIVDSEGELWSTSVDRCVDNADAAELGLSTLRESQLGACVASKSSAASGKIVIEARCPGNDSALNGVTPIMPGTMPAKIKFGGSFTARTMDGELLAEIEDVLEPMSFKGTLTARRTGNC